MNKINANAINNPNIPKKVEEEKKSGINNAIENKTLVKAQPHEELEEKYQQLLEQKKENDSITDIFLKRLMFSSSFQNFAHHPMNLPNLSNLGILLL